jgi:hypothetical protein
MIGTAGRVPVVRCIRGDKEDRVARRDRVEVGNARVLADRQVRPGSGDLLQVPLEYRWPIADRNLSEPAGHPRPCRRMTCPRAARTFCTQLHRSPSIDTRYHWSASLAMPRGKRVVRPERRPDTSSVTQRRGARPRLNTAAQIRASRRAVASAWPPEYMARSRSGEIAQVSIVGPLLVASGAPRGRRIPDRELET